MLKPTTITNIAPEHVKAFRALTSDGFSNFALFSCCLNGEPASAIVAVAPDGAGGFVVTPLFVSVTPAMVLTDHDGIEPEPMGGSSL
jgi:hypothetical protein